MSRLDSQPGVLEQLSSPGVVVWREGGNRVRLIVDAIGIRPGVVRLVEDGLQIEHRVFVASFQRNPNPRQAAAEADWVDVEVRVVRAGNTGTG